MTTDDSMLVLIDESLSPDEFGEHADFYAGVGKLQELFKPRRYDEGFLGCRPEDQLANWRLITRRAVDIMWFEGHGKREGGLVAVDLEALAGYEDHDGGMGEGKIQARLIVFSSCWISRWVELEKIMGRLLGQDALVVAYDGEMGEGQVEWFPAISKAWRDDTLANLEATAQRMQETLPDGFTARVMRPVDESELQSVTA